MNSKDRISVVKNLSEFMSFVNPFFNERFFITYIYYKKEKKRKKREFGELVGYIKMALD